MADRVIEELDEAESLRLIAAGGIGRIAYASRFGPAVLPVNYKWHDGAIVFRTTRHSALDEDLQTGIAGGDYLVAFEIDEIDEPGRQGWSVLIQGPAHHVEGEARARGRRAGGRRAVARRRAGTVPADRPAPRHRPPDQARLAAGPPGQLACGQAALRAGSSALAGCCGSDVVPAPLSRRRGSRAATNTPMSQMARHRTGTTAMMASWPAESAEFGYMTGLLTIT